MPLFVQPLPGQTGTPNLARYLSERNPTSLGMNLAWLRIPAMLCLFYGLMFGVLNRMSPFPPSIDYAAIGFVLVGAAMMFAAHFVDRRRDRVGATDAERARRAIGTLYLTLYYGRGERDLPPSVLGWLEEATHQRERILTATRHPRWEGTPEAKQASEGADQAMTRVFALAEPTITPTARQTLGYRGPEPPPFTPPIAGTVPLPAGAEPIQSLVTILRSVADELEAGVASRTEVPSALIDTLATLRARREAEAEIDQSETV